MNSGDIQEKRDFIYKEAYFILENEELFKTGTFALIKKKKNEMEINKIKLKETHYVIKKKKINDDDIEELSKKIIKEPLNLNNLMNFNIKKSNINSHILKKKSKELKFINQTSRNSFDYKIMTHKMNQINNKKKISQLTSYEQNTTKSSNFFPHLSTNIDEYIKPNIKIPKKLFVSLKKKSKIKKNNIDTEKLINDLKKTQLKFIIKNQKKLNKEKRNVSNHFKDAFKNYFESHNHNNYFILSAESNENRFVKVLNEYEKSKKLFPKMKKTINEIEKIEGENEKRKIRISDHVYCITDNLEQMRNKIYNKSLSQRNTIHHNSISFDNKNKIKLKSSFIERNIKPMKYKRKKNNIELMIYDIEKENDLVNHELEMWKKV